VALKQFKRLISLIFLSFLKNLKFLKKPILILFFRLNWRIFIKNSLNLKQIKALSMLN